MRRRCSLDRVLDAPSVDANNNDMVGRHEVVRFGRNDKTRDAARCGRILANDIRLHKRVIRRRTQMCASSYLRIKHQSIVARGLSSFIMIYNTMQYNAMQCNAMQCNAMQCNAMQCNAMQCNAMQCNAMQCNAMQCNAMQCNAMQCNAMQCNAMQCNAMQNNTILVLIL